MILHQLRELFMLRELVVEVDPVRILDSVFDQTCRLDDGLLEVFLVVAVAADSDAAVADDLDPVEKGGEALGVGDGGREGDGG